MQLACTQALASNSVLKNASTYQQFYVSDFNGDGADDVVVTRLNYGSNAHTLLGVDLYISNGSGTAFTKTTIAPPTPWNELNIKGNTIFPGDYNGDGIQDILLLAKRATVTTNDQAFLYLGGISSAFYNVGQTGTFQIDERSWAGADKFIPSDFDGDGATDLFVIAGGKTEIYRLNGTSSFQAIYSSGWPEKNRDYIPADFNGDGKTDFLTHGDNTTIWHKLLFTGTGFVESSMTFTHTPSYTGTYSDDKMVVADINGDGKTDIVHGWSFFSGGVSTSARIDTYTSTNDGFKYAQHTVNRPLGFGYPQVFDFNGDGRSEIIDRPNVQSAFDIFYFNKDGKELQLKKVKNGVGHVTEWVYKRMNEAGSFYTRGALSTAAIHNIQLPLYLTYELRRDNGIGGVRTMRYAYEEAKLHRAGKGFLGMRKVTADDLAMGMRSVQELAFNTTYNVAAPYRSSTYLILTNSLLSQTTQTTEFVSMGSKRYFLRTNSSSTNHALQGYTSTDTYTYDVYGNVTKLVSANGAETTTTTTVYAALGTAGTPVPYRPTSVAVANTRGTQTAYTVTTTYAYNALGQLTSKVEFSGKPKSVTTSYIYDLLGYPKSSTTTPTGVTARTSSMVYDSKGRYPLAETDPIGLVTSYTYDARWGSPTKITTPDGLSTTSAYDIWGRRTSTTTSDGYAIVEGYGWDVNVTERTVSYHLIQHPGQPDVKVWYDVLDRDKKRQTEGLGSAWATEVWTYDSRGNQITSTLPYKSSEGVLTTTTSYDGYNRPVSVSNSIGTTRYSYSYSSGNLTTTTTNPASQVSSTVTDRSDRMVSATDYGGTLAYTYNSQGNLTLVKLGSSTVTVTEYDDQGRQKTLIDPNAGTTRYVYDALGQLTSQTNANGQVTTTAYDKLGRPTTRTGPEGTTTYEYFGSGQGVSTGNLKKVTGFASGNSEEFTYSTKGHLATKKVTIDNVGHTTSYTYDAYGRVSLTTYPSGLGVQTLYDGSGEVTQLKQSTGTVLFTATGRNGLGQLTTYSLGNGKSSANFYSYGIPIKSLTTGLQDLRFNWDYRSGNLTSREDAIKAKSESFTYDNLNRLKDVTTSSKVLTSTSYASNGNIATHDGLGTYTYDATRIHAVSGIGNSSSAISNKQQTVTYTAFQQPDYIGENGYTLTLAYGPDYERIKSVLKQGSSTQETRYYFDGFEKQVRGTTTKYIQYLSIGNGVKVIVVSQGTTHTMYYTYTDYLGSILTVTNSSGAVTAEQNFDAWGRHRNPSSWAYTGLITNPDWLYRGYTAHEALPLFGLVNMNGRLYDPMVGRMLSVDNYVQSPDFTQSYNRYSYVLNNPLRYIDPSGEFWHIVIGAAIGGLVNGFTHLDEPGGFWKGFAIGAVAGAVTAATGGAAASALGLASTGVLSGAVTGSVGAVFGSPLQGIGNSMVFDDPYTTKQWGKDILIAGVIGGIVGGASALFKGVNVWNGRNIAPGRSPWSFSNGTPKGAEWGPKTVVSQSNSLKSFRAEQARDITKGNSVLNLEIWDKSVGEAWESLTGQALPINPSTPIVHSLGGQSKIIFYSTARDWQHGLTISHQVGKETLWKLRFYPK